MPSSVIEEMRYDPAANSLEILYRGKRGRYLYRNVPQAEWEAFRGAASKGTYLNEVFKAKEYPYERVTGASRLPGDVERWGYESSASLRRSVSR